jgi:peroxidase
MLAVFGQFLDHDITATAISQGNNGSSLSCCPPNGNHPECFPVKVGPGDPVYDITGSSCMEFVRSAPAAQCAIGYRQQLNQVISIVSYYLSLYLFIFIDI